MGQPIELSRYVVSDQCHCRTLSFIDAHASLQLKPISDEAYGESFTAIADLADSTLLDAVRIHKRGIWRWKAPRVAAWCSTGRKKGLNDAKRYSRSEWKYVASR